jgi:hypothetical protein
MTPNAAAAGVYSKRSIAQPRRKLDRGSVQVIRARFQARISVGDYTLIWFPWAVSQEEFLSVPECRGTRPIRAVSE